MSDWITLQEVMFAIYYSIREKLAGQGWFYLDLHLLLEE